MFHKLKKPFHIFHTNWFQQLKKTIFRKVVSIILKIEIEMSEINILI